MYYYDDVFVLIIYTPTIIVLYMLHWIQDTEFKSKKTNLKKAKEISTIDESMILDQQLM